MEEKFSLSALFTFICVFAICTTAKIYLHLGPIESVVSIFLALPIYVVICFVIRCVFISFTNIVGQSVLVFCIGYNVYLWYIGNLHVNVIFYIGIFVALFIVGLFKETVEWLDNL